MIPEPIEVACHNSATSCTLSGPAADVAEFVAVLKDNGVFARAVNVSNIAYHSRYIQPAAPRLLELLKPVLLEPRRRSVRWVSTSVRPGQHDAPEAALASAEYFTNNLLSSVYFEEGCRQIPTDALVIEIAPHGLLQAILKRSLAQEAVNIAMTKRDSPGATMVLGALGKSVPTSTALKYPVWSDRYRIDVEIDNSSILRPYNKIDSMPNCDRSI